MYRITNSGLLISDNDTEILKDVLNSFKNQGGTVIDNTDGSITINLNSGLSFKNIELNREQKFKYDNNISDSNLDMIREMKNIEKTAEIIESKNKELKKIIDNVNKGNFPDNQEYINIYSEYLDDSIRDTKANIVKKQLIYTLFPFLLTTSFVLMFRDTSNESWMVNQLLNLYVILGFFPGFFGSIAVLPDIKKRLTDLADNKKELEILLLKREDLRTHIKKLEQSNNDFNSFVTSIKKAEANKSIQISDEVLKRIQSVINLVSKLPKEEQKKYDKKLYSIIVYYRKKRLEIIENKKTDNKSVLVFEEYSKNKELALEIEKFLIPIENEVNNILEEKECREKEKDYIINESNQLLQEMGVSYKNGWTDGYDDSLTPNSSMKAI